MFFDVFVYLFTFIIFIIKLHIISGAVRYVHSIPNFFAQSGQ